MLTKSLDETFENGGSLHDIVAGNKDLSSSWMMHEREQSPELPEVAFYAIDRDDETVARASSLEDAVRCANDLGGTVRPVVITDSQQHAETLKQRAVDGYQRSGATSDRQRQDTMNYSRMFG